MEGHRCLSLLMYKAKAHSRYGQDIVGSDRWQRQPQQETYILFSVCGHLKIPHVSKDMDASCRRKSNNRKRTRKWTRPFRFERSNAIRNGIMFNFYPGLLYFIQISTTLLASFSMISEAEHPSGACWSSLQNLFSPVFAHLALLQDSFHRCFLIMCHISTVASQFMLSEFLFLRYITQN